MVAAVPGRISLLCWLLLCWLFLLVSPGIMSLDPFPDGYPLAVVTRALPLLF
jgi:hypothetical protein